jgi:hypothetical protein
MEKWRVAASPRHAGPRRSFRHRLENWIRAAAQANTGRKLSRIISSDL